MTWNWCFWTVVLEKTLESPLDCKEIQPVHSEGDQPWDFFGRNDAKDETPVLWPPHAKSQLFGKDFDAGRDWWQEEKGTTEDEMAGWHHWLDGSESDWTPGVGDGPGGLACSDSWGHKESDMTERLNWGVSDTHSSPYSVSGNSSEFLSRWTYQFVAPASSISGRQIWAVILCIFLLLKFGSGFCPVTSILWWFQEVIYFQFVQVFSFLKAGTFEF